MELCFIVLQVVNDVKCPRKGHSPEAVSPTTKGRDFDDPIINRTEGTLVQSLTPHYCNSLLSLIAFAQEKELEAERQLQGLSQRVAALQLERDSLQKAVEIAVSASQVECTRLSSRVERHWGGPGLIRCACASYSWSRISLALPLNFCYPLLFKLDSKPQSAHMWQACQPHEAFLLCGTFQNCGS